MKTKTKDVFMQNRVFGWIAVWTGLILLIPLVLTRINISNGGVEGQGWYWRLNDFIVMGTLIFGMASAYVLVARKIAKQKRLLVGILFLLALLFIWAELAVGVFTNWGS